MSSTRPPIEDLKLRMPDDMDVRHCYRHPERETGVSCSNCGRPICHECMIPAAVGFRCPDCVAQQRRHAGRARVVTRGQMRRRCKATSSRQMTKGKSDIVQSIGVFSALPMKKPEKINPNAATTAPQGGAPKCRPSARMPRPAIHQMESQ